MGELGDLRFCHLVVGVTDMDRALSFYRGLLGMDIVEIAPMYDHNDLTSIACGRLIMNLIGTAVRAGYFE